VRQATSADVNKLASVLARAFYDDPPLVWMLPNPATRLGRINRVFTAIIGIEALRHGGVDIACDGEEILGGAIWLPPDRWKPRLRVQIRAAPRQMWALSPRPGRMWRFGRTLEDAHPKEPHWYLEMIGVDPDRQGQGIASRLLRSRLKRCDQEEQPAYLETARPGLVSLYEHFGFRRTRDLPLPRGGPAVTAMWRSPLAPPAT
jgi:GNAT superfamily N-acetyltransferase